jgi:dihydrofolate synthase/folylpolyglutamate synthase
MPSELPAPRTVDAWQAYIQTIHHRSIDLSLDRVRWVQAALELVSPDFLVVTVAGTNGKGSTVAMLEAMLAAAGYHVGAYTSPHLVMYNERIRVNRQAVSDQELCQAFETVESARGETPLTYFEFGTLAALWLLARQKVQVALLEVGLGGRLDAVNVLDADVALLTSVGTDHAAWLGNNREQVGREKAGIFRSAKPAVCIDPDPPVSVARAARDCGADFFQRGRDFGEELAETGWNWWGPERRLAGLPWPALRGRAQLGNASGALMALSCLRNRLPVSPAEIRRGLLQVVLAGRFQLLPGKPLRILDVAHNREAAEELRRNLLEVPVSGRTLAVFSMLRDKPVEEVARVMSDVIDCWYIAPSEGERALPVAELGAILESAGIMQPVRTSPHIEHAYRRACQEAGAADRVVVFGSLYTVGAILRGFNFSDRQDV